MKRVLEVISWALFIIAIAFAIVAFLCCIGGAASLFIAIFNTSALSLFNYMAFGYFGSVAVLLVIYLCICLYRLIERRVGKYE